MKGDWQLNFPIGIKISELIPFAWCYGRANSNSWYWINYDQCWYCCDL